jgi:hypothetical protein
MTPREKTSIFAFGTVIVNWTINAHDFSQNVLKFSGEHHEGKYSVI